MKRNLTLTFFCLLTTLAFAQVQIDKTLQMTGTFPDNQIVGAGALGIGTSTPAQKIDVVGGDINVDGSSGYRINNTATSGQYLRGNGTRFVSSAIQASDLPANSGSYIQNQNTVDQSASFRISGTGYVLGRVGIGTSDPQDKLNVIGNIVLGNTTQELGVSTYSISVLSGAAGINSGNGREFLVQAGASDNAGGKRGGHLYLRPGIPTAPATTYGNVVIADAGGNTGIGTNSPNAKLDVLGTNSDVPGSHHLRIGNNFGFRVDASTGQALILEGNNSGTWHMGLTMSRVAGNVGIGTATPAQKLDVSGDINTSTGFRISNTAASGQYLRGNGTRFVSSAIAANDIPAGSTSYIQNQNSADQPANFRISGTGAILSNVGIGSASPADRLHVQGGNIRVVNGTAGIDLFNDPVSHRGYLKWTGGGIALFNRDNSPLFFGTTDAERMRIDAAGNVSIGGHTPNTRLDLGGTSGNKPLMKFSQGSNTNVNYVGYAHNDVLMGSYIGTSGYPQSYFSFGYLQDPNRVFHFGGASDANFNASTSFVSVFSVGAGASADVNNGNEMRFHTSTNNNTRGYIKAVEGGPGGATYGGGAGLVLATSGGESIAFKQSGTAGPIIMTLTSAGRCGIGTDPNGQLELSLNEGRKPGSNVWTIVSDERLKTIEGEYKKGLNEILQLNPVSYHYKNVGERVFDERVLQEQFVGFSAQEVQKVFPECVGVDGDGYLNLNTNAMLVAYVNAFKEQQAQIDQLKKENTELKTQVGKMDELDKRMNEMNQLKTELEHLKSYLQQEAKK